MTGMIELTQVGRTFRSGDTELHALQDISLTIDRGEQVAIVGPSGSGKTTLLNLIGALDRPSTGTVRVLGWSLETLSERAAAGFRKQYLGFVFQDDALVPELNLGENVELPLVLNGMPARQRRERVHDVLDRLGLGHRIRAFPPTLSGGEKQRAAVARAIIHDPTLVLADEPTANLDAQSAGAVLELLLSESRARGITVLLATHDPRVFDRFSRTIRLLDGRLAPTPTRCARRES